MITADGGQRTAGSFMMGLKSQFAKSSSGLVELRLLTAFIVWRINYYTVQNFTMKLFKFPERYNLREVELTSECRYVT
jgi:hypothetical protein